MNDKLIFEVNSTSVQGLATEWEASEGERRFKCAIPTCFGGPGSTSSPEDFLAHALSNCFVGTFKVIATNSKLSFEKIEVKTTLEVHQPAPLKYQVKGARLEVKVLGATDENKARALLRMTQKAGIILNSVSFPVEYVVT